MEATPFEQEVFAAATNLTLVPVVLPFDGLEIVTPANADVAASHRTRVAVEVRACFFIFTRFSPVGMSVLDRKPIQLRGIRQSGRNILDGA